MKTVIQYTILIALFTIVCGACIQKPRLIPAGESPSGSEPAGKSAGAGEWNALQRMDEYLTNGMDKIQSGALSEGIKQLVAVLAEREALGGSSSEADELANAAEIELARIGAAFHLEPDHNWLDKEKKMITGSAPDITPEPNVILTFDTGLGRVLVANAPVVFQFVKGSGALTSNVNTSDYGLAACKVVSFDNNNQENIIRASLVFNEKGFNFPFEGVTLDFVYRPPLKRAAILVLEQSELGIASDPVIFNPVYNQLRNVAFDFSLYNSVLQPEQFLSVYSGDRTAITEVAADQKVAYLVVVFNDVFNIKELQFGGTGSGLFYAEARATLRIMRVADAKILYQVAVSGQKSDNTHGQGGTPSAAVKHTIDLVSAGLGSRLARELPLITEMLTGGE